MSQAMANLVAWISERSNSAGMWWTRCDGRTGPGARSSSQAERTGPAGSPPPGRGAIDTHESVGAGATGGRTRNSWLLGRLPGREVAAVGAGLALLLAGCGGGDETITGSIQIFGQSDSVTSSGDTCSGAGGYDDIEEGAQVTVKDGDGDLLATADLGPGEVTDEDNSTDSFTQCDLPFTVDVPASDFYVIEVSHRGEISYSREELEKKNWKVELSLGS